MDRREAEELCNRWLPVWTGNRPQELVDFYADNAFYRDPTVRDGLNGRNELLQYFTKLLRSNPEWVWTAEELFPAEKGFILKWKAVIPVKDERIVEYGMDIVECEGGRITRNEVYFDSRGLIEAILAKRGR